jgi:hypothetical protein
MYPVFYLRLWEFKHRSTSSLHSSLNFRLHSKHGERILKYFLYHNKEDIEESDREESDGQESDNTESDSD